MVKKRITDLFTDYRLVISLQILGMLILRDIIQDVFYLFSGVQSKIWNGYSIFIAGYVLCIFVYEVIHKKIFTSKIQNLLWIFFAFTLIGTSMRREGLWIKSWIYEFLLLMKIYIFFILIPRIGKENTDHFIYKISKWVIAVFCAINTISLLIWFLHLLGFPELPGIFAYSSMVTTENHPGDYQFFGLYEWVTDGSHRTITALVLGLFLYSRKQMKTFPFYLNLITSFAYIILAGARSAFICLVPIVMYLAYLIVQRFIGHKFAKKIFIVVLVLGIVFVGIKIIPAISELIHLTKENSSYAFDILNAKSNGRMSLWKAGIEVGMQKPLFGWGWAYYPSLLIEKAGYIGGVSLHNTIINVFVFSGISGVISLLVFFIISIWKLWKNRHLIASTKSGWLLILVICGWIQSMLQPGILGENSHVESIYFWIAYGYLIYLDYGNNTFHTEAVDA